MITVVLSCYYIKKDTGYQYFIYDVDTFIVLQDSKLCLQLILHLKKIMST